MVYFGFPTQPSVYDFHGEADFMCTKALVSISRQFNNMPKGNISQLSNAKLFQGKRGISTSQELHAICVRRGSPNTRAGTWGSSTWGAMVDHLLGPGQHVPLLRRPGWGAPGWLSRLSIPLQLGSWSRGLWVRAPPRALCWQLRAWSLLHVLCLPLLLPHPHSCSVFSLSLSLKNKY